MLKMVILNFYSNEINSSDLVFSYALEIIYMLYLNYIFDILLTIDLLDDRNKI